MTIAEFDRRALNIAQRLQRSEQADISILFGSRARGDYEEGRSDIDVLLVRDDTPTLEQRSRIERQAEQWAQSLYGWKVPVQTVWITGEGFDRMRRTVNHVVARALQDGVIMPRDPEDYNNRYGEEEADHSYEWTVTDERYRHAEQHLATFNLIIDSDLGDMDEMIGQHAHQALEHAMKALVSAHGRQYKTIHNLNELVGDVRRADPEFRFRLAIYGGIYNQYTGHREYYRTANPLTSVPGYAEATRDDVSRLLERVREMRNQGSR